MQGTLPARAKGVTVKSWKADRGRQTGTASTQGAGVSVPVSCMFAHYQCNAVYARGRPRRKPGSLARHGGKTGSRCHAKRCTSSFWTETCKDTKETSHSRESWRLTTWFHDTRAAVRSRFISRPPVPCDQA